MGGYDAEDACPSAAQGDAPLFKLFVLAEALRAEPLQKAGHRVRKRCAAAFNPERDDRNERAKRYAKEKTTEKRDDAGQRETRGRQALLRPKESALMVIISTPPKVKAFGELEAATLGG